MTPEERNQVIEELAAACDEYAQEHGKVNWAGAYLRAQKSQPAAQSEQVDPRRNRTEDYGHENGHYVCRCSVCGCQFYGHKRRVMCKVCAAQSEVERDAWQPIETAPKDGREVLLQVKRRAGIPGGKLVGHYMGGGHCIEGHPPIASGWYFWNGCMFDDAAKPTHWMPLPEIATEKEQGK